MTEVSEIVSRAPIPTGVLVSDATDLLRPSGLDLLARTAPYLEWQERRCRSGLCPYPNSLAHSAACTAKFRNGRVRSGLDFATRDPLALGSNPEVQQAAHRAFAEDGARSLTTRSRHLAAGVGDWLGQPHVVLFESVLDARLRTISALVQAADYVVIDRCADPSFLQAARDATPNVIVNDHLDVDQVHAQLCEIRSRAGTQGILVVTEALFALQSDAPDLAALQQVCWEHEARLLVDVSSDVGLTGPDGTGQMGVQRVLGEIDLVVGGFASCLVSNVGFLATASREAAEFVKFNSGAHVLARSPSPIHCAVADQALRVARSSSAEATRVQIQRTAVALRAALAERGLPCLGDPSPYVLVYLGWEGGARLASALTLERGLYADLIEHPIVPPGAARLCLQVNAEADPRRAHAAAEIIADSVRAAWEIVARR